MKEKLKRIFYKLLGIVLVLVAILGLVKWKTDWLDEDKRRPARKLKKQSEAYYIDKISNRLNGATEVVIEGGRIDIVTDNYTIEVERAPKWKEAIGQSLWYAFVDIKGGRVVMKKRKPKIILLMRRDGKDDKYLMMLNSTLKNYDLDIDVDLEEIE